jgi:hypothetical protein
MESTGVYWIPLFQILETRGFEVKLVNAHHVKTLPRRKTDVLDCQWLQQLHELPIVVRFFSPRHLLQVGEAPQRSGSRRFLSSFTFSAWLS